MTEIKQFPCNQCGAKLTFKPGSSALRCEHCQHENPIPQSEEDIHELDFRSHLNALAGKEQELEARQIHCQACGATTSIDSHTTASQCPFCGSDVVAEETRRYLRPKSLLPFFVMREEAWTSFRKWLKGLWFAPNDLKKYAKRESKLKGVYVPFWTYDASTTSYYSGQRGDNYWVTETYTENGQTKTRQVQKIRWSFVSGVVWNVFDDVLVLASESLPKKHARKLEPWDLGNLVPYADDYLSGFQAESYKVDLGDGFEEAKGIMEVTIRQTVCGDIGGDHQRISSLSTQHDDVTFKHVLLPVWISAYRFRKKVYRILINARTGEVQGERPWSWVKITAAILAGAVVIAGVIFAVSQSS